METDFLALSIKHVRIRDGVYQYERRVPLAVRHRPDRFAAYFKSRPLFRKSLGTKDANAMLGLAGIVAREFDRLVSKALESSAAATVAPLYRPAARKLTESDLSVIAERYQNLTSEPFEKLHRTADASPAAAAELARMEYELELHGEAIRSALSPGAHGKEAPTILPLEEARHVAEEQGFDAPEGSEQLGLIARSILVGMDRGYKRLTALSEGSIIPSLPQGPKTAPSASPTLGDAIDRYLDHKQLPPKTTSEVRLAQRLFDAAIGNKRLDQISRDDIQGYVKDIAGLKIGGKSHNGVERYPSEDTVKKRLGFINAAINHAIDTGAFDGRNPASNVKASLFVKRVDRAIMPDKRPLRVSEINKIFQHPWFTGCRSASETHIAGQYRLQGANYWVPIVAVLTGCRAGEIAGLRVSDVRLDDEFPHLLIRHNSYRGIKNDEARSVPIIDMLAEHAFREFVDRVKKSGADRLFFDWEGKVPRNGGFPAWSNGKIIRSFNRTVIPASLDELDQNCRQEVTFHNLRGAFKTMLSLHSPAINMNIINEVVGHAKSELDVRYIGKIPIEETYPAIRACRYSGLTLPPLPWA